MTLTFCFVSRVLFGINFILTMNFVNRLVIKFIDSLINHYVNF